MQALVYGGNNWVSYDDATTLKMKIYYANRNCLGGTMVWAASTDDAKGSAAAALSRATGLKYFHSLVSITPSDAKAGCVWTNCGDGCPFGYAPAALSGGGLAMMNRRCPDGKQRSFCCPNNDVPTCRWEGRGHGVFCNTGCSDGWIDVAHSTAGCWFGSQSLCCSPTLSDALISRELLPFNYHPVSNPMF